MKINRISNINQAFGASKSNTPKITPEHISVVTDLWHSDMLDKLDSLGLLNKKMLVKVKKAAEAQRERSTAESLTKVLDTIIKPVYLLDTRDNGYYYNYENPYNFRESFQAYTQGNRRYHTPILNNERGYLAALDNLAKNGNIKDVKKLSAFMNHNSAADMLSVHVRAIEMLSKIADTPLSICVPQEGKFGLVSPMDVKAINSFVKETIFAPLLKTTDILSARIKTGFKTWR